MTGTTHALAGAALGTLLRGPRLSFIAGVASHALLDLIPHQDYRHDPAILVADGLAAAAVLAAAAWTGKMEVLLGAIGGIAPDLEHPFHRGEGAPSGRRFISHLVVHGAPSRLMGVITEIAVASLACAVFMAALRRQSPGRRPRGAAA